jgi:hypothetical protein
MIIVNCGLLYMNEDCGYTSDLLCLSLLPGYYGFCDNICSGVLGLPSLKTVFGRQHMENDAAEHITDSSCFSKSIRLYCIRTGDSETIFLEIIPDFSSYFSIVVSILYTHHQIPYSISCIDSNSLCPR